MTCKHAKKKNSNGEWSLCSGVMLKVVKEAPTPAKPKRMKQPKQAPTSRMPGPPPMGNPNRIVYLRALPRKQYKM